MCNLDSDDEIDPNLRVSGEMPTVTCAATVER